MIVPADAPTVCKNCEALLAGPFCAQCGQEARPRIVPFRRFAAETLRDFFSFDTRFFRTLGALLRRPGFLTNEYVAGRRVRFMPPLRFYLLASFLFFFIVTLVRLDFSGFTLIDPLPEETARTEETAPADAAEVEPNAGAAADTLARAETVPPDSARTQRLLYRFGHRLGRASRKAYENRTAFENSLLNRLPPLIFLLLPFFALLLKLLYHRHNLLYAQHFIFALHFHAFAFLVLLVLFLLAAVGFPLEITPNRGRINLIGPIFLLILWIYLFLALRRVYRQSLGKSLLKLFLLKQAYLMIALFVFGIATLFSLLLF